MDGEDIKKNVLFWLSLVDKYIHKIEMFLNNEQFTVGCVDFRARYYRGRKAIKMRIKAMILIERQINYDRVSYKHKIGGFAYVKNEIMLALKDEDIRIVGICGMGGVRKTTLARQVAQEEGVFDNVVWLTVGQNPDYDALKKYLLRKLNRMSANAILLIILDDVWNCLDLDDLGINPDQLSNGCKIIMTSRDIAVLSEMGCEKIVLLDYFTSKESWQLFKSTLGDDVDFESDPDLELIAIEIVRECVGLPLAVVVVANSLRRKPLFVWRDALRQLKHPGRHTEGIAQVLYTSLQLSYDNLDSEEARSIFFLCSLFPPDFNIQMDHLMLYGWGLQLFSYEGALMAARDEVYALVKDLEESSLLMNIGLGHDYCIQMRSIVRDFALRCSRRVRLAIYSQADLEEWPELQIESERASALSLSFKSIHHFPQVLHYPHLEILALRCGQSSPIIPPYFFEGIKALKVLHLSEIHDLSLPNLSSIRLLRHLRVLLLEYCVFTDDDDLSLLRLLVILETLSFYGSNIRGLPLVIRRLTKLRMLNLSKCDRLTKIPTNLISRLSRLEILYMKNNFVEWGRDIDGKGSKNMKIDELISLSLLSDLEIHIPEAEYLPNDSLILSSLERFKISIGSRFSEEDEEDHPSSRILKFSGNLLNDRVNILLKRAEAIYLDNLKDVLNADDDNFIDCRYLKVQNCVGIKALFKVIMPLEVFGSAFGASTGTSHLFNNMVKFPCLEVLNIYGLDQLEVICDNQISTEFFPRLRIITVVNEAKIPTIENTNLHEIFRNLEELTLMSCMSDDFESVHRRLDLQEYDNVLPKLNALTLWGQSKLMLMWNKNSFVPKFRNLKELELWNCNTLRYIFTSSTVKGFPCLQTLRVESCSVVQVMAAHADADADAVLPQLKSLILNDLPRLRPFSNKHFISKLQCLETLIITQCPQMKTFTVEYFSNTRGSSEIEIDELNKEAEEPINNITSISFFGNLVAFPSLVRLKLSDIDSIRIPTESLGLLRELEVQNCSELREVFSFDSWRFKKLPCLEKLIVENCPWVRQVFDFQGIISNDNESYLSLGDIKRLSLINLPRLEHFCKEEEDSPPSLFSCNVARHLVHLEVLEVVKCEVEEIVAGKEDANSNMIIDFSRVHSVKLKDLPNLVRFCSDNKSRRWSNSLKTLEVEGCPNLETLASVFFNPPEEAIKHEFVIVSLSLHHLDNLKEIWKLDHHPILLFNHLSCLTIQGCNRLRTLFTPTIAGSLSQLQDLIVDSCEIIGEILSEERSGTKKIQLPKLKTIKLKHLPKLVSFLSGEYMLELPLLEHVRVEECPQLQSFSPGNIAVPCLTTVQTGDSELEREWKGDLESTIGFLFQGQVPFSEHRKLDVIDPDEMKEILEMKLHYKAFRQLKKLHVEGCDEELRNFLSTLLFRFQELTELHIKNCYLLELFNLERLIFEDKDEVFKKLEELTLSNLPNLMCIWNKEMVKYVSLKNLKRVDICQCGRLVNLFSPTIARDLQQLEVLNIHECDMMEEIFAAKAEGDGDKFQEIHLPKLHHLQLIGLSNLKTFHSENYSFELKTLWIERCPQLKSLTPGFITTPKAIHDIAGISEESVKNKMVGFPRLERLHLKSLNDFEEIWQESVASESFTELLEMEIDDCGKLSNVIPHDMLPRLKKLERIMVKDCRSLRKVFDLVTQLDEQESKNQPYEFNWKAGLITVFEYLQVLKLSGCYNLNNLFLPSETRYFVKDSVIVNVDFKLLPKLKFLDLDLSSLALEECHVTGQTLFEQEFYFKNLEELHLVNLGSYEQIWDAKFSYRSLRELKVISVNIGKKLLKIVPSNMLLGLLKLEKMYVQHCDSLEHIFDLDGIKDSYSGELIPQLMVLVLNDLPKMERIFSKEPTRISVFRNIESLRIIQCESLSSLFPASVAKRLDHLQELKVFGCEKMRVVIAEDKEDSPTQISFPKLKCLVLKQLPQLKCFYGGKNDIVWRVLNEVRVKSNPSMETFGHGSQITPELKAIHVTFLEKHWKGGLNETIKFLYERNNKPVEEDKAKKDKGKEIIQEPY